MGSRNFNTAALQACFDNLTSSEQAAQWVRFVDALDAGDAGFHRYYLILAPIYDRGETPFDGERTEMMEPRRLLQGELDFGAYEEEFEVTAFAQFSTAAELLIGSPPF